MQYLIFSKKQITFYGSKEDYDNYKKHQGKASELEINLDNLLKSFGDYCDNNTHYLISRIGKQYSIALLHNPNNKYNIYIMIYDKINDKRAYSVNIQDIPDLLNNEYTQKIINKIPAMCNFTETLIKNNKSQNIWMLDDLQKFANAIDKYDLDYE